MTDPQWLRDLTEAVDSPSFPGISSEVAAEAFRLPESQIPRLFPLANTLRQRHKGDWVKICGIVNAKAGSCPEKCNFCAQSAHFDEATSPEYPLMPPHEIRAKAAAARAIGVREFSIVTAGTRLEDPAEIASVAESVAAVRAEGLEPCVSVGMITDDTIDALKSAGLVNFHHNLETARSFHDEIVETHDFDEELASIRKAQAAGLSVCAGGILGMGETPAQRIELAETLADLDVDHIPINFLNPIDGTPLEGTWELTPMECLRIIAVYRLMLPTKDVFVMGGREVQLRDLQSMIFYAGANGMMMGGYLTTGGRNHETDLRMIRDLGLRIAGCGKHGEEPVEHPVFAAVRSENGGQAAVRGSSLPILQA